jgi:hypothetical protein
MQIAPRHWVALAVLLFVANAAVRPAIAQTRAAAAPAAPATTPPPPGTPPPYPYGGTPPPPSTAYPPPPGTPPPAPPPGYPPYQYPGYPAYAPPYQYQPQAVMQPTMVHRPRRGLVVGGAVTFGVTWGIAASLSLLFTDGQSDCTGSCRREMDVLWVPVAGPLWANARGTGSDSTAFFALWSAAELAGIIMFSFGVAGHDVASYRVAQNGPTLELAPMVSRQGSGLGVLARW